MTQLTLGSLFDGIGGFPLGGIYAGMKPVWASEIEPFPIRVTRKRLPFMKHYGDIHKLHGGELEPVDVITFGSPCHNLSVAGKRAGLQGEQSSLFFEAVLIIKEMRYSSHIWERIELVPGYQYVYRMDKELFYVYMIAHTAKHLKDDGGIGIRAFLDLFVYRRNYMDELDHTLIEHDLKTLKLDRFAQRAYALTDMWFGDREPDPDFMEFGDYILNCGAGGSKDNFVMNNEVMRKDPNVGKWAYIWKRAFPSLGAMQTRVPKLKKYPFLLPYYWIKRLSFSLQKRRDFIRGEIKSAENIDREKMLRISKMYSE